MSTFNASSLAYADTTIRKGMPFPEHWRETIKRFDTLVPEGA
jgi:hypothetical protein